MFTGIVSDIGTILAAEQRGDLRLTIACDYAMDDVAIGASIACSGVCLTVVDKGRNKGMDKEGTALPTTPGGAPAAGRGWFAVDASAETVSRTAPGMWETGRRLNLERALKLGEELGGHIVTGHVDGIATVRAVTPEGDSHRVDFVVGADLAPFIAAKGSVTVDGVSLTVNAVRDEGEQACFSVNIIPHSWSVTTLDRLTEGSGVNIEIDVLARYLARMAERRAAA